MICVYILNVNGTCMYVTVADIHDCTHVYVFVVVIEVKWLIYISFRSTGRRGMHYLFCISINLTKYIG